MVDQESIINALGGLIGWLDTWRTEQGAYNGFVVHRTEAKRMWHVHDTAWTQSAIIRGYSNLYRRSHEQRWGESMRQAADLLASRYDPCTGRICYTGHEDDRFESLVSCALGVCALLSTYDLVDDRRRKNYIGVTVDHVKRYWFDVLWVEDKGIFKFSEVDFYSLNEDRFVVNFNTMAVEALLGLYDVTGDKEFRDKAYQVGEWLIERWNYTQGVNAEILVGRTTVADNSSSDWMPPGGFSYQFTLSQQEPDNYVTLYNGLSLRGLYALYRATRDGRFAEMIRAQSEYLLSMRDPETRLFYHTAKKGHIEKNPQFVAGAGMTLVGLHEVMPLIGDQAIPEDTIKTILGMKYVNGSYPGFLGKNDTGLSWRGGGGVVWEDVAASMNWNAQWFEYLTRLIVDPEQIDVRPYRRSFSILNCRFLYRDTPKSVQILSWWPPLSWGLFCYTKKRAKAWIAIYPALMYSRFRSWLRGIIA